MALIQSLRALDLKKSPSVSETLDWARTLVLLGKWLEGRSKRSTTLALRALMEIADPSRVMFGTDYPYRSATLTYNGIKASGAFNAEELERLGAPYVTRAPEGF